MAQNKTRVPVKGTVGKSVRVNPTAISSSGAILGVNLMLPNGQIPSLSQLAALLQTAAAQTNQPGNINTTSGPASAVLWDNVLAVPPNISGPPLWSPAEEMAEDPPIIPGRDGRDGTSGSNGSPGVTIPMYPDEAEEPLLIPGMIPGPAGPAGTQGSNGTSGVVIPLYPEDPEDPIIIPGKDGTNGGGGGGSTTTYFGSGAPVTLFNSGDLYFDTSSGSPLQGYVQSSVEVAPSFLTGTTANASTATTISVAVTQAVGPSYLIAVIVAGFTGTPSTVLAIAGGSLVWTKYAQTTSSGGICDAEIWYAPLTGSLSGATITATFTTPFDDACIGIIPCNNFAMFDAGSGFPGTGTNPNPATLGPVTTTTASAAIFYVGAGTGGTSPVTPPGYTQILAMSNSGATNFSKGQVAFYTPASILTSYSLTVPDTYTTPAAYLLVAVDPPTGGSWQKFG